LDIKLDPSNKKASYKITTTVILEITVKSEASGDIVLSGYMTKQKDEIGVPIEGHSTDEFHLARIGRLVEDNESNLKQNLENVYFSKTQQVVFNTRLAEGQKEADKTNEKLRAGFYGAIGKKE